MWRWLSSKRSGKPRTSWWSIRAAAAVVLAITTLAPARGAPAAAAVASAPGLDDVVALEAYVDGVIKAQMDQLTIPTAAVSIVKDGRLLFSKGYGYADRERKTPINPETSLFRLASITKLFTETAVLQLAEAGKVDLDRDVNLYLKDVRIPATFPQPITLRHLLTHTAGFEESFFGHGRVTDDAKAVVTAAYLREHMPARVRPVGEMHSYSNYGIALAGLIVERVSGERYADYVERHIFKPLGMAHATVRTPVPASMKADLVQGYRFEQQRYVAKPFELHAFTPAGAATASINDVARFMIALLQDGRYGDRRILSRQSVLLLESGGIRVDRRFQRSGLGLFGQSINNVHVAGHTGDTSLFHNYLYLLPDQDIGIFVSYMGDGGVAAREGFMRAFFDRYFPAPVFEPSAGRAGPEPAADFAGQYAIIRRNHTKIDKLPTTWGATLDIESLPDGQLLASWPVLGWEWRFAPVAPDHFREIGGHDQLIFRVSGDGKVRYLLGDFLPFLAFEPLAWYESPRFWLPILGACALLFLSVFPRLRRRIRKAHSASKSERHLVLLSGVTAGWAFASVIAVAAAFLSNPSDHISIALKVALVAPILFVALTLATIAALAAAWRRRDLSLGSRLHHSLVGLAALMLCAFFYQWNLLGWHFG